MFFNSESEVGKLASASGRKLSTSMYIFIACCSIKQFLFFKHEVIKGATTAHKIHKYQHVIPIQ